MPIVSWLPVPMRVVPLNHSYLSILPLPGLTATESVAFVPEHTLCATGGVLMVGLLFTVTFAVADCTVHPLESVTFT